MTVRSAPRIHHLLRVADLTPSQFSAVLDLAAVMKRHPLAWRGSLEGRTRSGTPVYNVALPLLRRELGAELPIRIVQLDRDAESRTP